MNGKTEEEEEEEEWKQQQKRGDIGRLTETKYPSRLRLGLQPSSILMFVVVVVVVCMCVCFEKNTGE